MPHHTGRLILTLTCLACDCLVLSCLHLYLLSLTQFFSFSLSPTHLLFLQLPLPTFLLPNQFLPFIYSSYWSLSTSTSYLLLFIISYHHLLAYSFSSFPLLLTLLLLSFYHAGHSSLDRIPYPTHSDMVHTRYHTTLLSLLKSRKYTSCRTFYGSKISVILMPHLLFILSHLTSSSPRIISSSILLYSLQPRYGWRWWGEEWVVSTLSWSPWCSQGSH